MESDDVPAAPVPVPVPVVEGFMASVAVVATAAEEAEASRGGRDCAGDIGLSIVIKVP